MTVSGLSLQPSLRVTLARDVEAANGTVRFPAGSIVTVRIDPSATVAVEGLNGARVDASYSEVWGSGIWPSWTPGRAEDDAE